MSAVKRYEAVFNMGEKWYGPICLAIEPAEDEIHVFRVAGKSRREARVRAIRKARRAGICFEDQIPFAFLRHLFRRPQTRADYKQLAEEWAAELAKEVVA